MLCYIVAPNRLVSGGDPVGPGGCPLMFCELKDVTKRRHTIMPKRALPWASASSDVGDLEDLLMWVDA